MENMKRELALSDTIVALSTPMGKGALAVIRVSGRDAFVTISSCFRGLTGRLGRGDPLNEGKTVTEGELKSRKRLFGIIFDQGRIIDEVILYPYPAPHSYTGEDVLEISCHCNPFIIREIIQLFLRNARLARPGEFTRRAFYNNRIDLTRAEAVGDLLNARTEYSHRAALSQLEGSLYKKIATFLEELTSYRIELELEIDFSEQDLPELDSARLRDNLQRLRHELERLLATGKEGLIIREGLKVTLVGAPNVGKSSLFNYLLESERAIVTPIPGTTRDYLEESLSINGYLVRLFDTAGLRDSTEEVESLGIARTNELIDRADRIIYMEDGEQESIDYRKQSLTGANSRLIRILNKADLLAEEKIDEYRREGFIIISVRTGRGIDELKRELTGELKLDDARIEDGILSNLRQIEAVETCLKSIKNALNSLDEEFGYEFTAFDLKVASSALEEIIGKITNDDMLDRIFAGFCIGK